MTIKTFARRVAKVAFFIFITFAIARTLGPAEVYINHDLARNLAQFMSGDVNAESIYDAYFYIDFSSVLIMAIVIYITVIKLVKKIRSK